MANEEHLKRLENTIDRIDRLYEEKEQALDVAKRPPSDYAQTMTGKRLSDLIDDMEQSEAVLNNGTTGAEDEIEINEAPQATNRTLDVDVTGGASGIGNLTQTANPNILLVNTNMPLPPEVDVSHDPDETLSGAAMQLPGDDQIGLIVGDFERRLRSHLESSIELRTQQIERQYQDKLKRIRRAAAIEVRKRQEILKDRLELQYKKKEIVLRKHYKKLMALANKVTDQKAQLQDAKRQFEDKLHAANALYNEVEEMRAALKEHLGGELENHAESSEHNPVT